MPVLFLFLILAGANGIVVWDWNQGQPRERRLRMEPVSAVGLAMAPRRPAPAAGLRQRLDRGPASGNGPRDRRTVTVNMVSEGWRNVAYSEKL